MKKKSWKKKISLFVLSILLIYTTTLTVDVIRMKNHKLPLFAIPINGSRTQATEFYGFGYKVFTNSFCQGITYYWSDLDIIRETSPNVPYSKVIYFYGCG